MAAGKGTRLGDGPLKQYRLLAGVPVVLRALRPFTSHPDVAQVVLVLPAAEAAAPPDFLAELRGQGLVLAAKRLERGRFVWPQAGSGVVSLTPAMLSMLLEGIDWRNPRWTQRPAKAG